MKKILSFVAAVMMSATVFGSIQYCQEEISSSDGDLKALLSMKHVSDNTYAIELVASGDWAFDAAFNVNCGVNQTAGGGIYFENSKWTFSDDKKTASVDFQTASAESVPTNLYGNYICMSKQNGGLVIFETQAITDIDWTATCATGPADEEAPVMGTASFVSATYTSITLAVTATDNVEVKRYHVVSTGVDKNIAVNNGQITITGLTASTTYSFTITAKDAAGNESANNVVLNDVSTLAYPAGPAAPTQKQADVRSLYSDTYTTALAHTFRTDNWGSSAGSEVEVEGNHYYVYSMTNNVVIWGNNNDGDDAIIAAEGYNDGTTKGLDLSTMEYFHFDLFVASECAGGVVFLNDDRLGEMGIVESGKWVSIDMPLSELTADKLKNVRWMKFDGFAGVNLVFIDNVFAWKEASVDPTAIENTTISDGATKTIENGQVVIIRDGVRYSVMGQQL